jgi:hypothetical protein
MTDPDRRCTSIGCRNYETKIPFTCLSRENSVPAPFVAIASYVMALFKSSKVVVDVNQPIQARLTLAGCSAQYSQ